MAEAVVGFSGFGIVAAVPGLAQSVPTQKGDLTILEIGGGGGEPPTVMEFAQELETKIAEIGSGGPEPPTIQDLLTASQHRVRFTGGSPSQMAAYLTSPDPVVLEVTEATIDRAVTMLIQGVLAHTIHGIVAVLLTDS